jgi:lipopolysaccharide/colanic/teichoic acid biosynthesis glycosyltransferase
MIRFFDILISGAVLILLFPILLVVSLFILVEDGLPVVYSQSRTGRNGRPFVMYKLRSMRNRKTEGLSITVGGHDPRILKVGWFIRKYKIDEIPQLFNVLKGQMSIVGPRPEVKYYTDMYDKTQRNVLSVKPGITDYASIEFRNENELLEEAEDPEQYYINSIMPEKIRLNQIFANNPSIRNYFDILFKTLGKIVFD